VKGGEGTPRGGIQLTNVRTQKKIENEKKEGKKRNNKRAGVR